MRKSDRQGRRRGKQGGGGIKAMSIPPTFLPSLGRSFATPPEEAAAPPALQNPRGGTKKAFPGCGGLEKKEQPR